MKTETCKLYSRGFWIFLPKIIKIDLYNSELYRFKVGAFFWDTVYIKLVNIFRFTHFDSVHSRFIYPFLLPTIYDLMTC